MKECKNLAVIIPALNEADTVGDVVKGALRYGCDVFVVDDCSDDATREQALEAGATVLSSPFVTGAWCATQAGLLYAMKKGRYDFFLTMDADGQHDPDSLPQLMERYGETEANMLIGSCPDRGSMGRRLVWRLFIFLTRLKIDDITSGLRLYDRESVKAVLSKEASLYDYQDLGVLLLLRRRGLHCEELPVSMCSRSNGCSRVFRSWSAVAMYMFKTCVSIGADWVTDSKQRDNWREYDGI
ncbi:glycosyltransferase family 2 protein [Pseudodesulfovibrio sediminis]|uniref:Glycosyl transferase family 2 n=1 Tax=Pseudodesulfovibrio sediminis TaxID=2810563 RepID=A0ABM7P7M7_9BACT|nr:glycosyltransferase family 2 protein [Pseudodesulfovibrio sediminis]BCS89480.1 glycosyl transferase family 2 [Pseudodesulfovibrio sediminis]